MAQSTIPSLPAGINTGVLTPPPGDKSVELFNHIFGDNWSSLFTNFAGNHTSNVLFTLLQSFNTVVLAAVSVVTVYMLMIGTMGTAHEGTPLGKRYNSIYTPFRLALSLAVMAPLPVIGISLLQALALMMAYFSFGAASTLTSAATQFMVDNGGKLAGRPSITGTMEGVRESILKSYVFQGYLSRELDLPVTGKAYQAPVWAYTKPELAVEPKLSAGEKSALAFFNFTIPQDFSGTWTFNFNSNSELGLNISDGDAGQVVVHCADGRSKVCLSRKRAMGAFINELQPAAYSMLDATYKTTGVQINEQASLTYNRNMKAVSTGLDKQVSKELKASLETTKKAIDQMGWMSLGSFYWTISKTNENAESLYSNVTTSNGPNLEKITSSLGEVSDTINKNGETFNYINRVSTYLSVFPVSKASVHALATALTPNQIVAAASEAGSGGLFGSQQGTSLELPSVSDLFAKVKKKPSEAANIFLTFELHDVGMWVIGGLSHSLVSDEPIASLANFGNGMINGGEAIVGAGIIVDVLGYAAGESFLKLGGAGALSKAANQIATILYAIALPLILAGAGLAFYLPMVPFILYTLGVVSVVIVIVESVVLAPLWGASLAMPEGEGMLGQQGKTGFMLLIGIILRPPLMVIGFFISFLLMGAMGKSIGFLFAIMLQGLLVGKVIGVITALVTLIILTVFMISVAHKIFGLVTWLPDNAMKWMGQQMQNLGEGGETKQMGNVIAGHVSTGGNTLGKALESDSNTPKKPAGGGTGTGTDNKTPESTETTKDDKAMEQGSVGGSEDE